MAKIWRGGWSLVEYSSTPNMDVLTEIPNLLKEGTGIEIESTTEEQADNTEAIAGVKARINVRSSDLTSAVYSDLLTAQNGAQKRFFRFIGIQGEKIIEDCDDPWNESVDPNVTVSTDTTDKQVGSASVKFAVGAGAAAGAILATEAIGPINLSSSKDVSLWIKSSVALNAGDLQLLLDDTANCASPIKSLNIPAISANAWMKINLPLGDASGLTSVISVGIKMVVDKGAFTLLLDHIVGVGNNIVVKNVIPVLDYDLKQPGAFNARKITGVVYGGVESDIISETIS
jgi:hypothetical protein